MAKTVRTRILTRKESRKVARKLKKVRKMAYSEKKPVETVMKSVFGPEKVKRKRKKKRGNKETTNTPIPSVIKGPSSAEIEKVRRKRQREFLKEEDKELKRYAKKLGYKKRKSKSLPKVFLAEGLDYILDVCDPEKRRKLLDESDYERSDSSDQESDFSDDHMPEDDQEKKTQPSPDTNKSLKSKKSVKKETVSSEKRVRFSDEPEKEDSEKIEPPQQILKEDIYGRTVDVQGQLIERNPTAAHQKLLELEEKIGDEEKIMLKKKIKGIINRVSEGTMQSSVTQLKELYATQSRNAVKDVLSDCLLLSCLVVFRLPDRLAMEYSLLIALLHSSVSSEIPAYFVEELICKFKAELDNSDRNIDDRSLDNMALILAHLCNFKIIQAKLVLETLNMMLESFREKDVQLILLLLTQVGFALRKQDPLGLKDFIQSVHTKIGADSNEQPAKVRFMFETLLAIKNNNVLKLANYDPSLLEHYQKIYRGLRKGSAKESSLPFGLYDLLEANEKGRWWIVGSAWVGNQTGVEPDLAKSSRKIDLTQFDSDLLVLAKKARMNTDLRRMIFCILLSAEDYMDAFEKLINLGLKDQQEREIIHVCVSCCLKETKFNPYYALLLQRFCQFHSRFQLTTQYALWDRVRDLANLPLEQRRCLSDLVAHLIKTDALGLSVLKVIEFAQLEPLTSKFLKRVFTSLFLSSSVDHISTIFKKVVINPKMKLLSDGLQIFLHHIMYNKSTKSRKVLTDEEKSVNDMINYLDSIWQISD